MNLISSKNTMKKVLKELQELNLITLNKEKRELKINKPNYKKTIPVKTLPNGDGFVDIKEFKDIVDISKVDSYKLKEIGNKALSIQFFDKDGNKLKTIKEQQI